MANRLLELAAARLADQDAEQRAEQSRVTSLAADTLAARLRSAHAHQNAAIQQNTQASTPTMVGNTITARDLLQGGRATGRTASSLPLPTLTIAGRYTPASAPAAPTNAAPANAGTIWEGYEGTTIPRIEIPPSFTTRKMDEGRRSLLNGKTAKRTVEDAAADVVTGQRNGRGGKRATDVTAAESGAAGTHGTGARWSTEGFEDWAMNMFGSNVNTDDVRLQDHNVNPQNRDEKALVEEIFQRYTGGDPNVLYNNTAIWNLANSKAEAALEEYRGHPMSTQEEFDRYTKAKGVQDWTYDPEKDFKYRMQFLQEGDVDLDALQAQINADMAAEGLEPDWYEENSKARQRMQEALYKADKDAAAAYRAEFEAAHPDEVWEYEDVLYNDKFTRTWFNPFDVEGSNKTRETINKRIGEGYANDADRERMEPQLQAGLAELDLQDKMRADPQGYVALLDDEINKLEGLQGTDRWSGKAAGQLQQRIWDLKRQRDLLAGYAYYQKAANDEYAKNALIENGKAWYEMNGGRDMNRWERLQNAEEYQANGILDAIANLWNAGVDIMAYYGHAPKVGELTQEEQDAFYIMYGQDPEAAEAYLDALSMTMNERNAENVQETTAKLADMGVGGNTLNQVLDVTNEMLKPMGTIGMWYRHLTGQEIDTNAWYNQGNYWQSSIKKATDDKITEANGGKRTIWNAVYEIGANIIENGSRMLTMHAAGLPSWVSTGTMGVGSFSSYYTQNEERTAEQSQQDLFLTAGLSALSETLTEYLSDAHFWRVMDKGVGGARGFKKAAAVAWNAFTGGVTESITEGMNDEFVNQIENLTQGDESSYNQDVDSWTRYYLHVEGVKDPELALEKAQEMAFKDHMYGILKTVYTSFFSGGVLNLAGGTYGANKQTEALLEQGRQEREAAIRAAQNAELETPEGRAAAAVHRAETSGDENNRGLYITPEHTVTTPEGIIRPVMDQEDVITAERAAANGMAVAMGPNGVVYIGKYGEQQYNRDKEAALKEAKQRAAEERQREQEQRENEAQETAAAENTVLTPSDLAETNNKNMRTALNAQRQGSDVYMAEDGTLIIGTTAAENYITNHQDEQDGGQLTLEDLRARWENYTATHDMTEYGTQEETAEQENADQENEEQPQAQPAKTVEQVEQEWGTYDQGLKNWEEFRNQWALPRQERITGKTVQWVYNPVTGQMDRVVVTPEGEQEAPAPAEDAVRGAAEDVVRGEQAEDDVVPWDEDETPSRGAMETGETGENTEEEEENGEPGRTHRPRVDESRLGRDEGRTPDNVEHEAVETGETAENEKEEEDNGEQGRTHRPRVDESRLGRDEGRTPDTTTEVEAERTGGVTTGETEEGAAETDDTVTPTEEEAERTGGVTTGETEEGASETDDTVTPTETEEERTTGETTEESDEGGESRGPMVTKTETGETVETEEEKKGFSRTVGNTTVTTYEDGTRTITRPEGAAETDDNGLNGAIMNSVGDDEGAAAVADVLQDPHYRRSFNGMHIVNYEGNGPAQGSETADTQTETELEETEQTAATGETGEEQTGRTHRRYVDPANFQNWYSELDGDQKAQVDTDILAAEIAYNEGRDGKELDEERNPYLRNANKWAIREAFQRGQHVREMIEARNARTNEQLAAQYGFKGMDFIRNTQNSRYNGVVFNRVTNRLTTQAENQLRVLEEMGFKYGMQFRVFDTLNGRNAQYNPDTSTVDIALDADNGALVRSASHEIYHYLEQYNREGAQRLKTQVLNWLGQDQSYNLADRLENITRRYAQHGERVDAESEVVADSMLDMLADPDAIRIGVMDSQYHQGNPDYSDAGKIATHIQKLAAWMKKTIERVAKHSPETRALMNQQEYIETVGDLLQREVREASQRRRELAYGTILRGNDLAERYFNVIEHGQSIGAEYANTRTMARGMFHNVYGKDFVQKWMAENGLSESEAEEAIEEILRQYTDGTKSMNKALTDAGFEAVEPGKDTDALVFAARQLERVRGMADRGGRTTAEHEGVQDRTQQIRQEREEQENRQSFKNIWNMTEEGAAKFLANRYRGNSDAVNMMMRLYMVAKQGIRFNNLNHTSDFAPAAGTYDINRIVSDIKAEFPTDRPGGLKMGSETLARMIREMYVGLDNALMNGDDFDFGAAMDFANDIAEKMADKCGAPLNDGLMDEERPIERWLKENRGAVIFLDDGQAQEAQSRYRSLRSSRKDARGDGIWRLNQKYRGLVTFTTHKGKGVQYLEDIAAENPWFLKSWGAEQLFDEFDDLLDGYQNRGRTDEVLDYNGVDRDTFVHDMSTRILWGWFGADNGLIAQVENSGKRTKSQQDYTNAIREATKHYHDKERSLQKEYEQKARQGEKDAAQKLEQELRTARRELEDQIRKQNENWEKWAREERAKLNEERAGIDTERGRIEEERANLDATMARLHAEAAAEIEDYRNQYEEIRKQELKEREAEFRRKAEELRKLMTNETRQEIENRLNRYKDTVRRTALQNRIDKTYKQLADRLLHPTNNKNVQENLRKGVAQALGMLEPGGNPASYRSLMFDGIRSAVQNIVNEPGSMVIPDPDLDTNLQELAEKTRGQTIRSMDTETLEQVSDSLEGILHMVVEAGKSISINKGAQLEQLEAEMRERAGNVTKQHLTRGARRMVEKQFQGSLMDPIRFFTRMERECGHLGKDMWTMLRKSLDRQITDVDTAERKYGEALSKYKDYWRWTGKHAQVIEAEGLRMTVGEAMTLYKYMQRKAAQRHVIGEPNGKGEMVGGGVYIGYTETDHEVLKSTRPTKVTQAQAEAIIARLTPQQRECADALAKLSKWCAELGNEVSMDMYGYNKYKEDNYIRIKIAPGFVSQTINEDTTNPFYMINNKGWSKNLQEHATAPVILEDIFSLTGQHTMEMIMYHAWGREMADIARIINMKHTRSETIRDNLGNEFEIDKQTGSFTEDLDLLMGENAMPYLKQLIKDINGLSNDSIERDFAGGLLSKYKAAAVSFNLSTAMKQPLSFLRAWDVISPRYWAGVAAKGMGTFNVNKNIRELKEHSPIYSWKQRGNFVLDAGRSVWDILYPETRKHGLKGAANWMSDKGMKLPAAMDNWTWANIWEASKNKVKATQKNLTPGSQEYWDAVNEVFNDCIDRTQVVDSILHRTQVMRGQTQYLKMVTSFMGEPLKTLNTMMDKVDAYASEPTAKNAARMVKTATIMAASGALQAVVSSLVGALRMMKDPEDSTDDFLKRLLGDYEGTTGMEFAQELLFGNNLVSEINPLNQIPLARDVLELLQGYDPDRADLTVLADLRDAGMDLGKAITGDSKQTIASASANLIGKLLNLTGMPVGNVVKESENLTNWIPKLLGAAGIDTYTIQYWRMRYGEYIGYGKTKAVMDDYLSLAAKARAAGNTVLADAILSDLETEGGWSKEDINKRAATNTANDLLVDGMGQTKAGYYASWATYEAAGDVDKARAMMTSIEGLASKNENIEKNQALFLAANKYGIFINNVNEAQTTVMDAWAEADATGDKTTANGIRNMLLNHGYTEQDLSKIQKTAQKRREEPKKEE